MKKLFTLIAAAFFILSAAGCGEEDQDKSTFEESPVSAGSKDEESSEQEIRAVSSSLTSPLELEQWGSAAKLSTAEQKYYPVPVRILSIKKGKDAADRVKKFMDKNDSYEYQKPDKGLEWVVAGYEIDIGSLPVDEGGADTAITAFVTGMDGGSLEYKGKLYPVTAVNMTDGNYYYEGLHKGETAFILPEGCIDYMLVLGEYGETQAYFTMSKNIYGQISGE